MMAAITDEESVDNFFQTGECANGQTGDANANEQSCLDNQPGFVETAGMFPVGAQFDESWEGKTKCR